MPLVTTFRQPENEKGIKDMFKKFFSKQSYSGKVL